MTQTSRRIEVPDWATSILNLRQHLRLTQAELGSRLHYSAMAVSRWETGKQEPTSQGYIQLGNLAGEPHCWLFWGRAGLIGADVRSILSGTKVGTRMTERLDFDVCAGGGRTNPATLNTVRPKMLAVPLLDMYAGAFGEPGSPETDFANAPIDQMIAAPALWSLSPAGTNCLHVRGGSMSPLINDGDIVAVDSSVTDPQLLHGKIVVASHRQTGLALARFLVLNGVHLLEPENHESTPVAVEKDRNWRIVGRVIWWIRLAP